MSQKAFLVKGLLVLLLVADIILLLCQFTSASYDIVSVTPLFFLDFANYLFPLSIILALLGVLASLTMKDEALFTFSSLTLYFIIFLAPYTIFRFPIYNDQLGFAVEILYGMRDGIVMPYQGEYSTLGHAFFTSIASEVLGLKLFQAIRFVEVVLVVACFVIYLSLAMPILKKNNAGSKSLLAVIVTMIFPAFALDPLVYSRGGFGLVVSTVLLFCMFKFMRESSVRDSILTTITFVTSSISYPLQPLIVVIATVLLALSLRLVASMDKNEHDFRRTILKALVFFVTWSTIQVYSGYASWNMLHEIIYKALGYEFFTGLEQPALRYVGEAAVYTNLRSLMVVIGWLMALFILLFFILSFLRNKGASGVELFAFSLIVSFCLLGVIYGITFHEPALRFYRNLIAAMPFALKYIADKIAVKDLLQKMMPALLLTITTMFLILNPVTKWGYTFVGYPTDHDVALTNFITLHFENKSYCNIYAPGSHQLLSSYFEIATPRSNYSKPEVSSGDEFDLDMIMHADYVATYYRLVIRLHWFGMDVNVIKNKMLSFSLLNNKLYENGELWCLIQPKK
jgi:hypothetical protein